MIKCSLKLLFIPLLFLSSLAFGKGVPAIEFETKWNCLEGLGRGHQYIAQYNQKVSHHNKVRKLALFGDSKFYQKFRSFIIKDSEAFENKKRTRKEMLTAYEVFFNQNKNNFFSKCSEIKMNVFFKCATLDKENFSKCEDKHFKKDQILLTNWVLGDLKS